ncbi:MAG: type III-B CRISPR-associated protein Cas10/Cmr2 [Cyanobacteriota bacterium]|nr:type III-B CRISPR-associated protein Cas10/Cmr2 [Cyanobacteriota bacterium]
METKHEENSEPRNDFYRRKLFALLHDPQLKPLYKYKNGKGPWEQVVELYHHEAELESWWASQQGVLADHIAAASDRLSIKGVFKDAAQLSGRTEVEVRHPLSGEKQKIQIWNQLTEAQIAKIEARIIPYEQVRHGEPEKVFWWFWRFYPQLVALETGIKSPSALLLPADTRIPDCAVHDHNSIVSALAGALFPEKAQSPNLVSHADLLLFTFSPVQEFIKSSRKLLDFWSGSYLLHYMSARLCWLIADRYGPDAVITPSLWGQEIIDAWILKKFPEFECYFREIDSENSTPVSRFNLRRSNSLSTAGFPNVITALVPREEAKAFAEELTLEMRKLWKEIGIQVRDHIRQTCIEHLEKSGPEIWKKIAPTMGTTEGSHTNYEREFQKWHQQSNWEWNKLWDAQLDHTWESYWTLVPLGDPDKPLKAKIKDPSYKSWKESQQNLAQSRVELPTTPEENAYGKLNVGTWWGSLQTRLGQSIQAIKNTRTWRIPVAPGERSTLSGMYSAVHPNLLYRDKFCEGAGLPAGSLRMFWKLMAEVYPGLFNGSEMLNAVELTKRMAWKYGGIAKCLGVSEDDDDLENLIRFPNLSSIASARFAHDTPEKVKQYWRELERQIRQDLPKHRERFGSLTRRPFQVPKTDAQFNPQGGDQPYNGVMFSKKWLVDDLGLQDLEAEELCNAAKDLRYAVDQAHQQVGLKGGSPSDWWVIVLADGDSMGKYVNGSRLHPYENYLAEGVADQLKKKGSEWEELLQNVRKRMGPATHVGLNRALLDFSNRLVPYLTEKRFCGRVVYSGGDDVMALLPLEDLPEYLLSLRAAWCGNKDPYSEFTSRGGFWHPPRDRSLSGLPNRPLFTMGEGATMSMGIVIANKGIPLPTVLENLWEAEKNRAKKIPGKDGLCFRVIYQSGNTLEALMKGDLLDSWWSWLEKGPDLDLGPVLHRLAEELPQRCVVSEHNRLFQLAATTILARRDRSEELKKEILDPLVSWLNDWEKWVLKQPHSQESTPLGTTPADLGNLLKFSAFWVDKKKQRDEWMKS